MLTKIRVNFHNENVVEGVNMSYLCDQFMSKLSPELKEQLKEVSPEWYHLYFEVVQVEP